jgi:hypothetical protein
MFVISRLVFFMMAGVSRSAESPHDLHPIPGMGSGLLGRVPPGNHWIWISVPGPRSYPIPILYISTTPFEIVDLETLIVLPAASFKTAEKLTRSALTGAECPNDKDALKLFSVEVVERSGRVEYRCALPQERACNFLGGLKYSANIEWDDKKLKALDDFVRSIQCKRDVLYKGQKY